MPQIQRVLMAYAAQGLATPLRAIWGYALIGEGPETYRKSVAVQDICVNTPLGIATATDPGPKSG